MSKVVPPICVVHGLSVSDSPLTSPRILPFLRVLDGCTEGRAGKTKPLESR